MTGAPEPDARAARLRREREHHAGLARGDPELTWGWGSPAGQERADRRGRLFTAVGGIEAGRTVLELGCGTGEFTRRVTRPDVRLVGLDLSAALLRRARARVPGVAFLQSDAEALPFRDAAFDLVYGCSVLHHLDVRAALEEVRRVLRPGGRLVFSEPNLLNPQVFVMFRVTPLKPWFGNSPDEMAFTRGAILRVLAGLGFRRATAEYFDFLHPSTPRRLVPVVARLAERLERLPGVRALAGSMLIHAER